jgi:hypothetical protein
MLLGLSLLILVEGCTTSQPMTPQQPMPATPAMTGNQPPVGPAHPLAGNQAYGTPSVATGGMLPNALPPTYAQTKVPPLTSYGQPINTVASKPNAQSGPGSGASGLNSPGFTPTAPLVDGGLVNATYIESVPTKDKEKDKEKDTLVLTGATKEVHRPLIIENKGETRPDLIFAGSTTLVPPPPPTREPKELKEPSGIKELTPAPAETSSIIGAPVMRMVASKKFSLAFEMKDAQVGSTVEVWATQDQKTWKKIPSTQQPPSSLSVEVPGEGTYGLVLIVKTASSPAHTPRPGDTPHLWIAVDTTRPTVDLQGVDLSLTSKAPNLVVRWKAQDRNFGPRPVTISYAESNDGPWIPLATGIANSGRQEIPVPAHLPRKLLIRVEASDLAGNIGSAQTVQPIRVDLPWPPNTPTAAVPETPATRPVPVPVEAPRPMPSISVVDVTPGN